MNVKIHHYCALSSTHRWAPWIKGRGLWGADLRTVSRQVNRQKLTNHCFTLRNRLDSHWFNEAPHPYCLPIPSITPLLKTALSADYCLTCHPTKLWTLTSLWTREFSLHLSWQPGWLSLCCSSLLGVPLYRQTECTLILLNKWFLRSPN